MSKRAFKKAMQRNRVTAVVSEVINQGKKDKKILYNLYLGGMVEE